MEIIGVCLNMRSSHICRCRTLGKGQRSWATWRPGTKGTTRRLGRTKKEAMASMIMLSDMTLKQNIEMLGLMSISQRSNKGRVFQRDSLQARDIQQISESSPVNV